MVFASLFAGLGVSPVDELAEGFADTCSACWDFISLNYDFVTDDEKIAVWSTGSDELPFMVDQDVIEAVRDWLFSSGTIVEDEAASGMAYYNNWYFPVLPTRYVLPSTADLRAAIVYSPSEDLYYMFYNTVNFVTLLDDNYFSGNSGNAERWVYQDGTWQFKKYIGDFDAGYDFDILWSSCDVYNLTTGEFVFGGSEPSDTQTISAEDYLSLGYIAPFEMDLTTGYSTWTAGAISVPGIGTETAEEEVVVPLSIPGTAADVYSFAQADV